MSVKQKNRTIIVLSHDEIMCDEIYDGIWTGAQEMRPLIPRRKWSTAIYRAVLDHQGSILNPNRSPYVIPNDEDLFSDSSFRWLDNCYLATNKNGKRCYYRSRNIELIKVIDLYFQIAFPMTVARSYRRKYHK